MQRRTRCLLLLRLLMDWSYFAFGVVYGLLMLVMLTVRKSTLY